ncbi:klaroid protein-like [Neocloeon triangulifer]|uniref:klaroid protein-like n=1 Tax=Neocloeon triangulifer TaxID=2078957 RepID=UPI00286EBFDB|nr:klaroid protein-like [Neocloeon triangulifer]
MEEETQSLRRSSRSRSRTPSVSLAPADGERLIGMREASIRIERYQAIREVVIEGQNEFSMSSSMAQSSYSSNGTIGLNNNQLTLEAEQNATNVNQEKKKRTSKTVEEKSRRTVKSASKKSTANGGTPTKKKSNKSQSDVSELSQEESVTTPQAQPKKRSAKSAAAGTPVCSIDAYRSTKCSPKASPQARKLYEKAISGQIDAGNSVFLQFYRNMGEWWNYYKKTDYTYSPLSQQRYEIAPGVYNMPNLSRRPLATYLSTMSQNQKNFNYNLSREDSDTEEFVDPRRWRYEEEQPRQFGLWRRLSETFVACLLFLYTYTIGIVVRGVTYVASRIKSAFSTDRSTNEKETRSYYYYKETLIPDNLTLEQNKSWTDKIVLFFAWIYGGLSRNWGKLLSLLILLLLAYAVYTAGWSDYLTDLSGRSNILHLCSSSAINVGTWITEAFSSFQQRTFLLIQEPLNWILNLASAFYNFITAILAAPFQIAFNLCAWLAACLSAFVSRAQEPIFQTAEMMQASVAPKIQVNQDQTIRTSQETKTFDVNSVDFEELAARVLASTTFKNLQQKQAIMSDDVKAQTAVFQKISGEVNLIDEKLAALSINLGTTTDEQEEKWKLLEALREKIDNVELELKNQGILISGVPDCCEKLQGQISGLQEKVTILSQVDNSEFNANILASIQSQSDLAEELKDRMRLLELDLKTAQEKILATIDEKMESTAKELAELKELKTSTAAFPTSNLEFSDEKLIALIREQISLFDADKTSMPDYALESSGGTILTTRCTESYDGRNAITYYLGMDWLYKRAYRPNNPRSIIQPSVNPGDCFAFKGATGMILIELSKNIHLTAVTMEHIPKSIAISGNIDSAPKDFSIWGFKEEQDPEPLQLGSFSYLDNGQALQTFDITAEHDSYQKIELRIESNHGHMDYTCIYRFRVHGVPT